MSNYNYRSFIWSLGTTTFRQSTLPLKLEIGCRALQNVRQKYPTEKWNTLYSEFLKELNSFDIINYAGSLPDKDARAITSFLEQLGLCNSERYLTNVGEKVIELSSKKEIQKNEFLLSDYGNLYFLQLLKKSYSFTSTTSINPFIATVVTIIENEYLTDEEFQFFVMTTTDNNKIFEASQAIKDYRESDNKQKFLFDYIIKLLFSMDNYKELYKDFVVNNSVKDCEIRNLGINMNGSQYEISQEKLYLLLRDCNEGKVSPSLDNITDILSRISSGKKSFWKKLMLGESNQKNKKAIFLEELLKKISSMTGQEFRQWFLYNWHFIKTKSTLDDYLDLNKRVLSMTEMFSYSNKITLNLFHHAYFQDKVSDLVDCARQTSKMNNFEYVSFDRLFNGKLVSKPAEIYKKLSLRLGETVDENNVESILIELDNQKFIEVIDSKFPKNKVIEVLQYIKNQYSTNNARSVRKFEQNVQREVSKDASTPTAFEYIAAIAWYYISEKKIRPLEALNLSLDGDFLPKTHASGGQSDLIFKYRDYEGVPDHDFILEVTLNKDSNQRRAEMEPVSRHLGEYKIKNFPNDVYCAFLTHKLDKNTEIHFRQQKITPYYYQGLWAEDNMIIPLIIDNVIYALSNNRTYKNLFTLFQEAYRSDAPLKDWWETEINVKLS